MSHTSRDKEKLLNRVRRIQGQLNGLERAISDERDCAQVLQTVAAARGAIHALMAEILEGHIRFLLNSEPKSFQQRSESIDELIKFVRANKS